MPNLAEKYDFALFERGNLAPELPVLDPIEPKRNIVNLPRQKPKQKEVKTFKDDLKASWIRIKKSWKQALAGTFIFCFVTGIAGISIYENVLLTEVTNQIEEVKEEIKIAEATEQQLKLNLDVKFNTAEMDRYVKNVMGMCPISKNQVVYINVENTDRGKIYQEIEPTFWDKVLTFLHLK